MTQRNVLVVAGDASGDAHAAALVKAVNTTLPGLHWAGVAGPNLRAQGVDALVRTETMNMVGVFEVLTKLPVIKRAQKNLQHWIQKARPDLIVLVDFGGFNLRLAKWIKRHYKTIPIFYYIAPQIWASRPGRIRTIKAAVDAVGVLFPFEQPLYEAAEVTAYQVPHPVLNHLDSRLDRDTARDRFGFNNTQQVIGLLPGSRAGEIKRLLPILLETAKLLVREDANRQFVLPVASTVSFEIIAQACQATGLPIHCTQSSLYEALPSCDAAIVASGTASLEVALLGIPSILLYKVHPITYWIARRLIRIPYLGIVNVLLDSEVMPECLQSQAEPQHLVKTLNATISNKNIQLKEFERLHMLLSAKSNLKQPEDIVVHMLNN